MIFIGYSKDWKKVVGKMRVERYQSSKFQMSYEEYKRLQ